MTKEPTQQRLRELFHFDPETGVFTHRNPRRSSVVVGSEAGMTTPKGYRMLSIGRKMRFAHRMAWLYVYGTLPKQQIDHINGIRDDNRIANLRDVSARMNTENQRGPQRRNKTGLLGVTRAADERRFIALIMVDGKKIPLGRFDDPEQAHQAYLAKKRELHAGCTI